MQVSTSLRSQAIPINIQQQSPLTRSPPDIIRIIFRLLNDLNSIRSLSLTCRQFHYIISKDFTLRLNLLVTHQQKVKEHCNAELPNKWWGGIHIDKTILINPIPIETLTDETLPLFHQQIQKKREEYKWTRLTNLILPTCVLTMTVCCCAFVGLIIFAIVLSVKYAIKHTK